MHRSLTSLAIVALAAPATLLSTHAGAAVVISSYTTAPAADPIATNATQIASISTANGTISTLGGVSGTAGFATDANPGAPDDADVIRNFWGSDSSEVDGGDALLGLSAATGLVAITGGDVFFGTTIQGAGGTGNDLFLLEFGSVDSLSVAPIDAAGNIVGSTLTLTGASSIASPQLSTRLDDLESNVTTTTLNGWSFDIEEFGTLTGPVQGLRLLDDQGSSPDPAVIGYNLAAVPEPATAALLGAAVWPLLFRRRR
jgi:hypothetical protein